MTDTMIVSVITEKPARRALHKPTQNTVRILAHCEGSCTQEMGNEQVGKILRCTLSIGTYGKKDIRMK